MINLLLYLIYKFKLYHRDMLILEKTQYIEGIDQIGKN